MNRRDRAAHRLLGALGTALGALVGLLLGGGAFLIATAFPAMLRAALPGMSDAVFLALWAAAIAVPVFAFTRVFRKGDRGARAYATCGIAMLAALFGGELSGTLHFYPWHARLYIVPGVTDRPSPPPAR